MNEHHELTAPTLADIVAAVAAAGDPATFTVTDYAGRQLVAAEITPTTVRLRFGRVAR